MSLEITDRDDFQTRLDTFIKAKTSLAESGVHIDREIEEKLLKEFLDQFEITTVAPARTFQAGYVVVAELTGYIPSYFSATYFPDPHTAREAIREWVRDSGRGTETAYGVREITYHA